MSVRKESRPDRRIRVVVVGRGKVGTALARALPSKKYLVELRSARTGPVPRPNADVIVFAVRDAQLLSVAGAWASCVAPKSVCVHVAGSMGPEGLAPLRNRCRGVAQMHPLASFADARRAPDLSGVHVHVQGDAKARTVASAMARALGCVPRSMPKVDLVGYHLAAALLANGSAALSAAAEAALVRAGCPSQLAHRLLGPLLRTVAENVTNLGSIRALTGPVRRGDVTTVLKHLRWLEANAPATQRGYQAAVKFQLEMARALGEALPRDLDAIETAVLTSSRSRKSTRA